MCGGTGDAVLFIFNSRGLSPRVRGNLVTLAYTDADERSIPACAGEPIPKTIRQNNDRVYPRVCGGTDMPVERDEILIGLSPRVRGNRCYLF